MGHSSSSRIEYKCAYACAWWHASAYIRLAEEPPLLGPNMLLRIQTLVCSYEELTGKGEAARRVAVG